MDADLKPRAAISISIESLTTLKVRPHSHCYSNFAIMSIFRTHTTSNQTCMSLSVTLEKMLHLNMSAQDIKFLLVHQQTGSTTNIHVYSSFAHTVFSKHKISTLAKIAYFKNEREKKRDEQAKVGRLCGYVSLRFVVMLMPTIANKYRDH